MKSSSAHLTHLQAALASPWGHVTPWLLFLLFLLARALARLLLQPAPGAYLHALPGLLGAALVAMVVVLLRGVRLGYSRRNRAVTLASILAYAAVEGLAYLGYPGAT